MARREALDEKKLPARACETYGLIPELVTSRMMGAQIVALLLEEQFGCCHLEATMILEKRVWCVWDMLSWIYDRTCSWTSVNDFIFNVT
mmetsp:Transcript_16444/g.40172  ORF Transcript_16444/g.40172 Transcript_16444/m.40172 type:complete len:89 (-) Transcript_16444:1054-1320(-)